MFHKSNNLKNLQMGTPVSEAAGHLHLLEKNGVKTKEIKI